ncbi:MAG: hypothetical protein CMM84_03615 [Rhodothermaceae bacterium]|nr:hypothetical protein [Rhodothermaceae bacterium]MBC15305.1 hypothetical protein [Rhodothermaceae bacterium]
MATIIDQTLPHDGAISLIEDDAPAVANTWNDPFGELNEILAHLGGALPIVVDTFPDLATFGPPDGGVVLAILATDRTLWANWGTAPTGDGTAVGAEGTRWVRLSPTRPRSIYHQVWTTAAQPAVSEEITLGTLQARTGAYGTLDIRLMLSDWARTQDPTAQIRIHFSGDAVDEDVLVVDVTNADAGGPLVLGTTHGDYAGALVTLTVYSTGIICPAGARRTLTARND